MNNPLVSILVPAYNVGKYIEQCLKSIVNQSYNNLQVVIVNDGSNDSTGLICDEFSSKYHYVEVYHVSNGGVAKTRNILLSKIRGDYTLFVDADDWIEPDMIERLVHNIQKNSLDIAVCKPIIERYESHTHPETIKAENQEFWNRDECIKKFLRHNELNGSLWNKLIKSKLFTGIQFNPNIWYGEDALVVWQILQRVKKVGVSNWALYHYRMNDESISHQSFGEKKKSGHIVWKTIYEDTTQRYPALEEFARGCYAVSDFWLLYYASRDNYKQDNDIRIFRKNLRDNLKTIKKYDLLTKPRLIGAYAYSFSYQLMTAIARLLKVLRKK